MNDERLLDCEFCGKRFFDIPDMALFGWDDARPMYACQSCDAAQQTLALDGAAAPKASGDLPADVLDGEGDLPEPPRQ